MIKRLYESDDFFDQNRERETDWIDSVPMYELFAKLKKETGLSHLTFTQDVENIRNTNYITIKSNDLADQVGFLHLLFKTLRIKSSLKVIKGDPEKNEPDFWLWGGIDFRYSHTYGGSNGYTFLYCTYSDKDGWNFREP